MRVITILIVYLFVNLMSYGQDKENWRLYKPSTEQDTVREAESEITEEAKAESLDNKEQVKLLPRKGNQGDPKKGEIRYIQDERISVLDDYLKANPLKHDGYRIQLVFGERGTVNAARSKFVSRWSYSSYEDYLPPNFRLRIGDFLTRFQAEKVLREIKGQFPTAYIVRDKIEVPKEYR